ncbi:hypothetical protein PHLGIDRAFT_357136 [Phlebiopsis gigantea 11061_1 CR5-6]|uniref:Uncharacterized protein n=1 Tax=Phlebiopsis gigantea (strain 11061_1 CR5-6) TaxID=745531 RepID=A0A0C3SCI8_PHLG1|nr:hypothetical protein PHLGIDRAFT_357136 [Phlebiopsis gigantea 11061_1 CR5-6]
MLQLRRFRTSGCQLPEEPAHLVWLIPALLIVTTFYSSTCVCNLATTAVRRVTFRRTARRRRSPRPATSAALRVTCRANAL